MSMRQDLSRLLIFALGLTLVLGFLMIGTSQRNAAAETKLEINGYAGVIQELKVPAALDAIKELKIGDPQFLKEADSPDGYGIASCESGVLQKGEVQVHIFKLHFQSEDQAASAINLKCKRSKNRSALSVEDSENCRNSYFGLYYDGTYWSGYRREKETLVLLKAAVSQEDFYRFMEKAI
jgi:hypothetical protein